MTEIYFSIYINVRGDVVFNSYSNVLEKWKHTRNMQYSFIGFQGNLNINYTFKYVGKHF